MLTKFICPDNQQIEISKCLVDCRLNNRCFPLPMLVAMSHNREWQKGYKWSVTELLQPPLYQYLMKTKEYAEKPEDLFYRIMGSGYHAWLDNPFPQHKTELQLENKYFKGRIDLYDKDFGIPYDYKFIGKFKAKLLQENFDKEVIEYSRQLNGYKILLEDNGYKVNELRLVAITRDFRRYEYEREKIKIPICTVYKIPIMEYQKILDFFITRITILDNYMITNDLSLMGRCEDTWGGKRCENYCSVNCFCPHYKKGETQNGL